MEELENRTVPSPEALAVEPMPEPPAAEGNGSPITITKVLSFSQFPAELVKLTDEEIHYRLPNEKTVRALPLSRTTFVPRAK